jgi:hypothetical protein
MTLQVLVGGPTGIVRSRSVCLIHLQSIMSLLYSTTAVKMAWPRRNILWMIVCHYFVFNENKRRVRVYQRALK